MAKHVKKSVIPIYLIGAAWLLYGLLFPLRRVSDYLLCAGLSAAAFIAGKAVFPDREYELPDEKTQEKPKTEAKGEEKPQSTGNPEVDKLIVERDKALGEMRRLNDAIQDAKISAQIDHLEQVTRKITDLVAAQPKKLPQIRKFMSYYLPTTLKILNAYDRMDATGIAGENIDATKGKVEGMMDTIVKAFDKQLDALYGEEAMDVSADITVMEQLLRQEGLGGMTTEGRSGRTGEGINLQL